MIVGVAVDVIARSEHDLRSLRPWKCREPKSITPSADFEETAGWIFRLSGKDATGRSSAAAQKIATLGMPTISLCF